MKKVLISTLILISIGVNAQYSNGYKQMNMGNSPITELKDPTFYIPATMLLTTFAINEFNNNLTLQEKTYIAVSGSVISVITYLFLNKHVKKQKGKFKLVIK
jgi:cell division protein FtsW (lipid II flippase)